jgi:hypothetical protein
MKLTSKTFPDGGVIPDACALAVPDPQTRVRFSDNRNPDLAWSGIPEGTRSLVLICVDPDAPSAPDDVNQEDREVPSTLPRADFYHWAMVDIDPERDGIAAGDCSREVTPGGKIRPLGPEGARQGINSYTDWFAGDAGMAGTYRGYDGPAPPWNDAIPHRYRFRLLATDLERCPVEDDFTADAVLAAVAGHVLDEADLTGTYTLNPRLRG